MLVVLYCMYFFNIQVCVSKCVFLTFVQRFLIVIFQYHFEDVGHALWLALAVWIGVEALQQLCCTFHITTEEGKGDKGLV